MKYVHLFAAVILPLALMACVPAAETYYRPSVKGGEISTGHCVPTESLSLFKVGDLSVRVRSFIISHINTVQVRLELKPSAGQRIYFVSDEFLIRNLDQDIGVPISRPLDVHREDMVKSPTVPFPVKEVSLLPYWELNFSIRVHFPFDDIEHFELVSPPIVIDGKKYEFPPIQFEQKIWAGIGPFNC
ncbi:hypothetical protein [Solemya velum gill symbiont]|uniref:hypothetical protein n=1 Tax=Solemya velum gill symbiont TaxID=2340 RepID=UPI00117A0D0E|nr:hypothetical protein [Solemya velum gill symbiont]